MKSTDWRDYGIRGILIIAGAVAAVLFVQHGQADALPPLALGGLLGAGVMHKLGTSEEDAD